MSGNAIAKPGRVGPHVYFYLGLALLLFNFIPIAAVVWAFRDETDPTKILSEVAAAVATANLAFWFARRRCSAPNLSGWKGLVLMATYMTIGVGAYSVIVAVPAVLIGIIVSIVISIVSLFTRDVDFSPRYYQRLIHFYYRNRMHQ